MVADRMTANEFLAFLLDREALTLEAVQRAKAAIASTNQPLDIVVRELGLIPEGQFSRLLANFLGTEIFTNFQELDDSSLLERLGLPFAAEHALVPRALRDGTLEIVIANPFAVETLDAVSFFYDAPLSLFVSTRSLIQDHLRKIDQSTEIAPVEQEQVEIDGDVDRLLDIAREAPIIRFVSRIVQRAVDEQATDIHIEPLPDLVRIRFRQNGMLEVAETVSKALMPGITSRIKILSRLNISERRLPQDGRLRMSVRGQEIDFRVSIMPSVHGETIVMRILDRSAVSLQLRELGYDAEAERKISSIAHRPNGIFLICGPTGSGKTTTLYAVLAALNQANVKIFTVEDPVEYRLDGVTQLQVEPSIGLTFAAALRSVLRQDPDVILIGEIRDRETAQIAIQSALTGHLVLSTLHTNSAAGAIVRLQDMGIENYLISATLRGIVSQRLVRTICTKCMGATDHTSCSQCHGSGYSGRSVTYEILEVSEDVRRAIDASATEGDIQKQAILAGMTQLCEHAESLVTRGITTPAEVARVIELMRS